MSHTQHNLEVALTLASQGFFIFPCRGIGERRKEPCYFILSWRKESTRDPAKIREWWRRCPDAVPAIDCDKSGLLILDGDCRDGKRGIDWAEQHIGKGILDCAPGSDTPSGGRHSAFRNRKDKPLGNSRGRLPGKDVFLGDVKGAGGYIIAPGARFRDGGYYAPRGDLRDALPIPQSLLDYLLVPEAAAAVEVPADPVSPERALSWGEAALDGMCEELAAKEEGERNIKTNEIAFRAGRMVAGGIIGQGEARARLTAAAIATGLPAREAASTVARGLRDGIGKGPAITGPENDLREFAANPKVLGEESHETPNLGVLGELGHDAPAGEERPIPDSDPMEKTPPKTGGVLSILAPGDWTNPDGLLGEIADWVMATSRKPNRPLAIASALATLAPVCGRHLYGPTGSALTLYIVLFADTTTGKNRPLIAPELILRAAELENLQDSGRVHSLSGFEQLLEEHPSCIVTIDEIGLNLFERLANPRASYHEAGIRQFLQILWSREIGDPVYVTTRKVIGKHSDNGKIEIPSPALSLIGATTPDKFWKAASNASISDGFLNRFLLCQAAKRGKSQNVSLAAREVPSVLVNGLRERVPPVGHGGNMAAVQNVFQIDTPLDGTERQMPWDPDVEAAASKIAEDIDLAIESSDSATERELMGRTYENGIRLAALHAVSRAGREAAMTMRDLAWGMAFSTQSTKDMVEGIAAHMAEGLTQPIFKAVQRALKGKDWVKRRDLIRTLAHRYKPQDLDGVLRAMNESGELAIQVIPAPPGGGHESRKYKLT